MVISIKHEMIVFWAFILCGLFHGVLFDFFRSLRKNISHGKILVAIEDIVFCSVAFKMFFDICYITNNGSLRWYIFASFICSIIIYFCVLSKPVFSLWNFLFKIIDKIIFPFRKITGFFYKKFKNIFLYSKRLTNKAFYCISDSVTKIFAKQRQTEKKQ